MNVLNRSQFPRIGKRILTLGIAAMAVAAFLVIGGMQARAQNSEQVAQLLKPYTDHAKTVVQRLTELNTLPAEEWRYHAGDLAHGESPEHGPVPLVRDLEYRGNCRWLPRREVFGEADQGV